MINDRIYRIPWGTPVLFEKYRMSVVYTVYTRSMIQGSVANGKQERRMRFTDMGSKERLKLLRPMFPAKARLKKTSVPLSSQVLLIAAPNRLMCLLCTGGGRICRQQGSKWGSWLRTMMDHDYIKQCGAKPNNFVQNWTMRLSLFTA